MSARTLKDILVIISTAGVTTVSQFLNGALTVALPTIGKDLNFREADLQWPIAANSLAYGCLLLFFGRLGDIVGAQTMFVAGSLWCSVWAIAGAFAPNVPSFIIFVALQGAGAAANTPGSIRILTSHFPPGNRRSQAFGILGAGQPIGFILGLIAGGLFASDRATWRAIFYIQAGLTFMFSVLGLVAIDKDEEKSKYTKGLDWCGAVISTVSIALLTYSLSESTSAKRGWRSPQIPSLFSVSVLGLGGFVLYQRWRDSKGRSVLVPFRLLNHPESKLGSMILLVFFAWFSFNSLLYWVTLYFQQVNLLTPVQTAVRFIPVAISGIVVNILTGFVMNRVSGYFIIVLGLLASIAAPMIFAFLDGDSSYWTMTLFVLIFVVGSDAVYPVGNLHCCSAFSDDSHALAGALFNVAIRIGTSLGLAITSSISTSVSGHYLRTHEGLSANSPDVLMAGFKAAGWTCCAASIVSFLIALVRFRGIGIVGKKQEQERVGSEDAGEGGDSEQGPAKSSAIKLTEFDTTTGDQSREEVQVPRAPFWREGQGYSRRHHLGMTAPTVSSDLFSPETPASLTPVEVEGSQWGEEGVVDISKQGVP